MPPFGGSPYAPGAEDQFDYRPGSAITDLILRAGDVRARQQERSGEIWGQTVAGLGQMAGQALGDYQQRKEEEAKQSARSEAIDRLFSSPDPPDPREIIKIYGPKDGADVIKALGALDPTASLSYKDKMEQARDTALGVKAQPADKRPAAYAFARNRLIANKVFRPEEIPEQYDETFLDMTASYGGGPKPIEVSPGAGLYDPQTKETTIPVPAAEKVDARSLEARYADAVARGDQEEVGRLLQAQKALSEAGRAPVGPKGPASLTPNAESTIINRLSNQWTKAAAPAVEIDRQVKLMDAGLSEAKKGNTAAGAQAVLVTFQKILDPTSVVRESEYARSSAGLALLSRVQGAYEKLVQGGAGVPIKDLENFAKLAKEASKAFSGGHLDAVKKRIEATAGRYNIPIETVIEDYSFGSPAPATFEGKQVGAFKIRPKGQ